ncbi:hypothetical protein AVME950_14310 [Acidovorax sp. SUPP950]|uniref:hypothetical protein n=1 Tax=Acidovorax sp. SUPP950 TaxID=511901 RepID=UPI0023D137FF|nr:hypothetical protein [Acidovorax sp. SUPP950]GKS76080.1 hypothetical protein AVME950_14310 [Acidovorax sp. SUPP950]
MKPLPAPARLSPLFVAATLILGAGAATAQTAPAAAPTAASPAAAPAQTVRLRGTIEAATPTSLTVKERGGQTVTLALSPTLVVQEVYPIALADIQPGSFIGTAALPQVDGTQRAIAVTVFPESARGAGEGHRPFDLQPQSTMTNATVADVAGVAGVSDAAGGAAKGRTLKLTYQGGEKTVIVPPGAPVVTFRGGDRSLLVPGASVSLTAQEVNGTPTATRINAGRNGFALPY